MPLIKTIDQGIAAGVTIFPWQGSQYEYLPFNALLEVALLADAGDTWTASIFSGTDVLLQAAQVDQLAIATPITYPDDYSLTDGAAAGERIGATLLNGSVGVADVRTAAKITPF